MPAAAAFLVFSFETDGCFWGWDQRFIVWLHGLVGVQVEATN
jgi:hypothetical protein